MAFPAGRAAALTLNLKGIRPRFAADARQWDRGIGLGRRSWLAKDLLVGGSSETGSSSQTRPAGESSYYWRRTSRNCATTPPAGTRYSATLVMDSFGNSHTRRARCTAVVHHSWQSSVLRKHAVVTARCPTDTRYTGKHRERLDHASSARTRPCRPPWPIIVSATLFRILPPQMHRDFEIRLGIYLVQPPHELDLHNNFDFQELRYSVAERTLCLLWRRSEREGIPAILPASVTIEFRGVTEFRFQPRDPTLPFTEDDCLDTFGYWTDEDWAHGVIIPDPSQPPDPSWLTAIEFMSGSVVVVQADSAHATITA